MYLNIGPLGRSFQFARMVLRNGLAFVVTASELPSEEQLTAQTSEELLNILNSFKFGRLIYWPQRTAREAALPG